MVVTRWLASVGSGDREHAGGKAASLGELLRAGIPVPPGYVVTAEAFSSCLAAIDPSGALRRELGALPADDGEAIAAAAAAMRARVRQAPLPRGVRDEITHRYRGLTEARDDAAVAVRSSATSEDSAGASFAGLQDTYLWVRGADAVLGRVRDCWASLYNAEAVGYRRRMGVPERGLAMGVVVQRMVRPRSAGVMFTRGPVTGDRSVVAVEGTWGLGSALVSGDVTPDSFTVSKVTGEITARTVAVKLRIHEMQPNGCGVSVRATPDGLRDKPCLTDAELRALARIARRVEDHYGTPQDIEWALVDDPAQGDPRGLPPGESIVILQSRPETAWLAREARRAAPVAAPAPRPFDHVLQYLGGGHR